MPRNPRFASLLAAALLLASCGDEPPPAAQGKGAAPHHAPPDVEWNPEDLKDVPHEHVATPGSGTTFLEGVVVGPDLGPVPGARVEMHASARHDAVVVPVLHASATAGPDGSFRVGPGPTPWRTQGILSARAPGFARTCLVSAVRAAPDEGAADEGTPVRVVLRPGLEVRGTVRGKDGGPPDAPVVIWAMGRSFSEVVTTDAAGAFSLVAPEGLVQLSAMEGAHPPAYASLVVRRGEPATVAMEVARGKDIRGRVLDAITGDPVEGAVVRGHYGETRLFRTDANGEFLLPRFWFRAFQVRKPGYAVRSHTLSAYSGEPGADIEAIRLHPGLVARGRVLDLDGRPQGGIRLRCIASDAAGDWVDLVGPRSAPDGSFTFVGLPLPGAGREVRLFGVGYGCGTGASAPVSGPAMSVVDGVEVRVPRLVEVEGRVEDELGAPVAGPVQVSWGVPKGLETYLEVLRPGTRTFADASGRFAASVPERTRFRASTEGEEYEGGEGEGESPRHPASAPDPGAGAPPAVVVRVFRGLSVRGTVRDASGRPVGRGEVRVEPSPSTDPRPSRDARVRPDGTFVAGGLAPGAYDFSVLVHPEFLQQVVRGVKAGAPPVEVQLRRPCAIRGRLVAPEGTPPQDPAEVVIRALGDSLPLPCRHELLVPGPHREFRVSPVSPGDYALTAVCGDARLDVERFTVGEGPGTDLGDLVLLRGAGAGGVVTAAGSPAPGTVVEIFRVGAEGRLLDGRRVSADAAGRWRLGGLLPGPHAVLARPRDRPLVEARFEAAAGEDRQVDLAAPAGGRVLVKVLDAAGAPVEGARVLFSGPSGSVLFWKEGDPGAGPHATGPGGTLSCTGLAAGDLHASADKPGRGAGRSPVKVADGGSVEVEVRLEAER